MLPWCCCAHHSAEVGVGFQLPSMIERGRQQNRHQYSFLPLLRSFITGMHCERFSVLEWWSLALCRRAGGTCLCSFCFGLVCGESDFSPSNTRDGLTIEVGIIVPFVRVEWRVTLSFHCVELVQSITAASTTTG